MPALKATERHRHIIEALAEKGRIEVTELSGALDVSEVTIRSDLLYLEKEQVLRRIRGGAIAVRPSRYERPRDLNSTLREKEKEAIASVAADMIRDGETVILDTGSTVAALARLFPKTLSDVVVVTNALNVATELSEHPGVQVIMTGGALRPKLGSLVSPMGTLILNEINADLAFMSCAGVDVNKGFTNSNWEEAEIKKAMIKAASRVVFLADHSKLRHVATARIAAIAEADMLLTDSGASGDTLKQLREVGLDVVIC